MATDQTTTSDRRFPVGDHISAVAANRCGEAVVSRAVVRRFGLAGALLTIGVTAGASSVPEQTFSARVVQVEDGDTVRVLRGRETVRIRLHGIDAPESGQAYGREAREVAVRLLLNQTATVTMRDVDAYGRLVADLVVDGTDIGVELVRSGAAWHFTAYSASQVLADAERQARQARRGLWAQPAPVAPWDYRATAASTPQVVPVPNPTSGRFHGNRNSKVFHAPGCQHYSCPNCTVVFVSAEAARQAGFRAHAACVR